MNRTKLATWIEQAEARSVCQLAEEQPGLFKLSAATSATTRTAKKVEKSGFFGRLCGRRGPVKGLLSAA